MKKYFFLSVITVISFVSLNGQVYSNQPITNSIPTENAFLDASSTFSTEFNGVSNNTGKGLVFPTVDLVNFEFKVTNIDGWGIFPTFFNGMIVYNRVTGTTLTSGNRSSKATAVKPGFYYYHNPTGRTLFDANYDVLEAVKAGEWLPLGGSSSGSSGFWSLTGNTGTDPAINFVGTTDNKPLIFRVDNQKVAEMGSEVFSALKVISNGNSGLRLPQMTTTQRDVMTDAAFKTNPEARGLMIFNTDNNCLEYWNSTRWISLCTGNADFIFRKDNGEVVDITIDPNNRFPPEGDTHGPWTPEAIPPCINPVPYSMVVVAGIEYTYVTLLDPSTGRFTLTMDENPTANIRTAIVRITNNCTNEYKDFLFIQDANTNLCQPLVAKPIIVVFPNNTACSGGAVYMSISNPNPTATYIWTFNNVEIARGTWYYANKNGIYRVYVGAVGCMSNASDEININISGTVAPTPAPTITAENNGIICSGMGGITLTSSKPVQGQVAWFKDGVFQGYGVTKYVTAANASAAGNDWIAVFEHGGCYSLPSNIIRVKTSSLTALPVPNVTINGQNINAVTFCKGGVLNITINNIAAYTGMTVNFIFKNGNEILDVTKIDDSHYQYIVPIETTDILFSVTVEELSGTLCNSSVSSSPVELIYSAPPKPIVTSPGTHFLICGTTAAFIESSIHETGYTYIWYRDGVVVPSITTYSFSTTIPGRYAVVVTTAEGCISERSDEAEVRQSGNPAAVSISGASTVNKFDVETYTISPETGVTYQWANGTNGAVLVAPSSGTSANYEFTQDGVTAQVMVTASNACGTITITKDVTVTADCTPPSITGGTPANSTIKLIEGQTLILSVNTAGTAPTFQWYKNNSPILGATSSTYIKTNVLTTDAGTYKVIVTGSGNCSSQTATVDNIAVIVDKNPANYPIGLGKFEGRTCFDVVETNNGGDCGTLAGRLSQKANFTLQAIYKQTYTFTTNGTVSKIRFYAIDQTELVIDSIVPGSSTWATGTNLNGKYTVTVYYKTNLNTTAAGKDRAHALTAMLYVVYNDQALGGGTDKRLELKVSVQDCSCCPGYLATAKEYVQKTSGYLDVWGSPSNFSTVVTYFTATGKDVCFFKKNYQSQASSVTEARAICSSGSFTTDASIKAMGWRLPNIAELGSINGVATNLSSQPTSISGTDNMTSTPTAGQGAYYWSDTQRNSSATWGWSYGQGATQLISVSNHVRCVRTQ